MPDKIVITGGSGFIGTNAVDYFLNEGYEVINLDIKRPQNEAHNKYWKECDILKKDQYENIVRQFGPRLFLHLAARTDLNEKINITGYNANILGVKNTIDIIRQCGSIERVIFASSRMVYKIGQKPDDDNDYWTTNLYGESKRIGELLVKKSELKAFWTIIRPTSIWGPWFDVPYKDFFETIKNGMFLYPKKHVIHKSFGFIGNTIYQISKIYTAQPDYINHKTMYLCDYEPLDLRGWANTIAKYLEVNPPREISINMLKIAAYIGDLLEMIGMNIIPLTRFRLKNLVTNMVYETEQIKRIAGECPYNQEEGVIKTVEWMKQYGK